MRKKVNNNSKYFNKFNNKQVIKHVRKLISEISDGNQAWTLHINSVVKYSKLLAKYYKADINVCEISAWLHDIIKMRNTINSNKIAGKNMKNKKGKNHHIHGSKEAVRILTDLNYPKEKISKIEHCILTHSSDKKYVPKTLEAKIVASADALSHFDNFILMIEYHLRKNKNSIAKTKISVLKKYKVAWSKLFLPKAKEIAKPKYDAIKVLFNEL
jgi:HD superfamily phosphohydrolase YqeK